MYYNELELSKRAKTGLYFMFLVGILDMAISLVRFLNVQLDDGQKYRSFVTHGNSPLKPISPSSDYSLTFNCSRTMVRSWSQRWSHRSLPTIFTNASRTYQNLRRFHLRSTQDGEDLTRDESLWSKRSRRYCISRHPQHCIFEPTVATNWRPALATQWDGNRPVWKQRQRFREDELSTLEGKW